MEKSQHLCKNCYQINKGYFYDKQDRKICTECSGTVLFLQEAADHIAELNSEIEAYKNILF
jgi:hypothetical protein